MAAIKRRRGRPKKSLNKPEPSDSYVYYDSTFEQKEFTGDVIHSAASIVKVDSPQADQAEWVTMVKPQQICFQDDCQKLHFHCPLCPVSITQFGDRADLQTHFTKIHTNQYFVYSDHVIVLCNLGCMDSFVSHYHCPKCGAKIGRSLHMRNHLSRCSAEPNVSEAQEVPQKRHVARRKSRLHISDNNMDNLWETVCVDLDDRNGDAGDMLQATTDDVSVSEESTSSCRNNRHDSMNYLYDKGLTMVTKLTEDQDQISHQTTEDSISESAHRFSNDLGEVNDSGNVAEYPVMDDSKKLPFNPEQPHISLDTAEEQKEGNWTESEPLLAPEYPHISIVRKLEDLECRRCQTCCRLFHCPLCPGDLYRSQPPRVIYNHLTQHYVRGVEYKGWTSMKCNLACGCESDSELVKAHWHCPLCPQKKLHRSRLRQHLAFHENGRTRSCRGKPSHQPVLAKDDPIVGDEQVLNKSCPTDTLPDDSNHHITGEPHESVNSDRNTDVCELSLMSDTVYTIKMEPDSHMEVKDLEECNVNDLFSSDSVNTLENSAAASLSGDVKLPSSCSLSSEQNKSEIHVVYVSDLLSHAPNSGMEEIKESVVMQKEFIDTEQCASKNGNVLIRAEGNIIIRGNESIIIEGDRTVRNDENALIEQGDNEMFIQKDDDMVLEDECHVMVRDHTPQTPPEDHTSHNADIDTYKNNMIITPEQGKASTQKSSEVFQVVTGVLTSDLVQKLEPVLEQFMSCLQDTTGISVILQDSKDYLLQGSWTQIYKSQIILDKVSLWQQLTALDIDSVFTQAQKDYPDLFGIQRRDDEKSSDCQDPLLTLSEDSKECTEKSDRGFKISTNEPCPYCMKRFRYKVSLFCHIIYMHDIKKKPRFNYQKWKTMLRRMAEVDKPECPSCGRKFTKVIHAQTHYGTNVCTSTRTNMFASLRDPATGTYRCEQCGYSALTPSVLMQHITYKHMKKTFSCPRCAKMFATEHILQNHLKNVHVPGVLCTVCGVRIKQRHFANHMRGHQCQNNQGTPSLKCGHCDYCTNTPQLLERHIQREHCREARQCNECGKCFQVMYDLYRHKQLEHGRIMSKYLSMYGHCPVCKKQMLKRNILVHVRLKHYNDRRYRCTTCNKMFQTKYVLNMHKETHLPSDERCYRYICDKCSMGFMTKTSYVDHVGTHNNMQPYSCSICGNKFRQKNLYRRHMQSHTQSKYVCEICRETCDTKESLVEHMKSHQNNDLAKSESNFMFVCLCEQAFIDMASLQEHTKSCLVMQQNSEAPDNISTSEALVQATAGGDTLILIRPDVNFSSENDILSTPEQEMFILKDNSMDAASRLTDEPSNESGEISDSNVQRMDVICNNDINLIDSDHLNMPLDNSSVNDCGTQEQDGFLCGYCSTLFVGLDEVQKHILVEHGDKLSS